MEDRFGRPAVIDPSEQAPQFGETLVDLLGVDLVPSLQLISEPAVVEQPTTHSVNEEIRGPVDAIHRRV